MASEGVANPPLAGRHILLGITGSIAAYKAAVLCRLLKTAGADVRVVMTPLAKQFITPLTMATLSKNPILVEFFDPENGAWNSHVSLGEWADCYLIAPATANTLAKMAGGIADNLLLTTYLSARCPVVNKHAKGGIVVKGMDDVAVRFSRCCAPVPGDEIVGYITRGRGVSIHRTDCVNVLCMDEFDRKRLIEAEWSEDLLQNQKMYMTEINIYANDSKGLVFSLSKIFNEENINLTGMNVRVNKQGKATVSVKFEIRSKEQLNKMIAKIRNVEGIIDIERTTG